MLIGRLNKSISIYNTAPFLSPCIHKFKFKREFMAPMVKHFLLVYILHLKKYVPVCAHAVTTNINLVILGDLYDISTRIKLLWITAKFCSRDSILGGNYKRIWQPNERNWPSSGYTKCPQRFWCWYIFYLFFWEMACRKTKSNQRLFRV